MWFCEWTYMQLILSFSKILNSKCTVSPEVHHQIWQSRWAHPWLLGKWEEERKPTRITGQYCRNYQDTFSEAIMQAPARLSKEAFMVQSWSSRVKESSSLMDSLEWAWSWASYEDIRMQMTNVAMHGCGWTWFSGNDAGCCWRPYLSLKKHSLQGVIDSGRDWKGQSDVCYCERQRGVSFIYIYMH